MIELLKSMLTSVFPSSQSEDNTDFPPISSDHFNHYYSILYNQQSMLQDVIKTELYRDFLYDNYLEFQDKICLELGCGSIALFSFWMKDLGAKIVYAVDKCDITDCTQKIINSNDMENSIKIIKGSVEKVELPEKIDIIVAEPMGIGLLHERMIESYITARDKYLSPNGKLFPNIGSLYFSLFTDNDFYNTLYNNCEFWKSTDFFGFKMDCLYEDSVNGLFSQPVFSLVQKSMIISDQATKFTFDFQDININVLRRFTVPCKLVVTEPGIFNGLAYWFDVQFTHVQKPFTFSTSPMSQTTHYYQLRLFILNPVDVQVDDVVECTILFQVNNQNSYDIILEGKVINSNDQTVLSSFKQLYFLHDLNYQFDS